ncbi:MAG: DUF389 domain-containing protein [Chloroflexi bacterium]|nr:DUF389 domain-containing protein [Chloroflexota bacterium]
MSDPSPSTAELITLRGSYILTPIAALLLKIGLWLAIGVFVLYDPVLNLTRESTGWVYIVMGLLLIPTVLSQAELSSWIGQPNGSYRLIEEMEQDSVTFIAGWLYILGWAALSALLALAITANLIPLIELIIPWALPDAVLAIILVAVITVGNLLRFRPAWQLGVWLTSLGTVTLVVLLFLLASAAPEGSMPFTSRLDSDLSSAIGLLFAAMWAFDLVTQVDPPRARRGNVFTLVLHVAAVPAFAGLLALFARLNTARVLSIPELFERVLPGSELIVVGISAAILIIAWQMLARTNLFWLQTIGADGCLPNFIFKEQGKKETPGRLIVFQSVLTILFIVLATQLTDNSIVDLGRLAAFAYLVLNIAVGIAALVLANRPRAEGRPITLPLFPIIQAASAGVAFLLLLSLSAPVLLIGVGWVALSLLAYQVFGRVQFRATQMGTTVFQDEAQLRITSRYPIVVAVANPNTAQGLVAFASRIAQQHNGHVVITQVIPVSDTQPLVSGRHYAQTEYQLIEDLVEETTQSGVTVEGITRLARSVPRGILDTIDEENARMLVIGWNATENAIGRRELNPIIQDVLDNAVCDVVVLRGMWQEAPERLLVPMAGGPHAPRAAQIGLDSTAGNDGSVTLLNVMSETDASPSLRADRQRMLNNARAQLGVPARTEVSVVTANRPMAGIIQAVEEHDGLLFGASVRDFLDNSEYFGQFPMTLAEKVEKPLALVRSETTITSIMARRAVRSISDVLSTATIAEERSLVRNYIKENSSVNINYYVLIALSAMIATLGLLLNSPAVIIGAMLVAPLMGPIVAAAGGIAFGTPERIREALTALLQGTLLAIFLAILTTTLSPIDFATPEVLARTRPNLLDLGVALVSGLAGAYVIAREEVSNALPGVAIAAALMPPVCTIGIGIALGDVQIAGGATLLFTANLAGIVFAGAAIFLLLGIRPPPRDEDRRFLRQGLTISLLSLIVISIPLAIFLSNAVQQDSVQGEARTIIETEIADWGEVEVTDFRVEFEGGQPTVFATLLTSDEVPQEAIDDLMLRLQDQLGLDLDTQVRLSLVERTLLRSDMQSETSNE